MKDVFIFRGKDISYNCYWLDSDTFIFDFGDGQFIDTDGNAFFFHCEYHLDDKKYIFEIWWEDDSIIVDENYMSNSEKQYVEKFMQMLIKHLIQ